MAQIIDLHEERVFRDVTNQIWISLYLMELEESDIKMTREGFKQDLRDRDCPDQVLNTAISQIPPERITKEFPLTGRKRRHRREEELGEVVCYPSRSSTE